jgi:RNA recognition motif-containing protein
MELTNMSLVVRNLSAETSETQVMKLFAAHGSVSSVHLHRNRGTGRSRRRASLSLEASGGLEAIRKAELTLNGNRLVVELSESSVHEPMRTRRVLY